MGRKPTRTDLNGLLPIYKPAGMVSKDVSRWLEKRLGRLKLGHVGTLDPAASGVLPILLGRATRLQDYLLDQEKAYAFEMELGRETDTLDEDGEEIATAEWKHVSDEDLLAAANKFEGRIDQIPPLFSAVKYKGKPLYKYAREGKASEVPLDELRRTVEISKLTYLSRSANRARYEMVCSRGTYVRVLVKDIAKEVGTCATLARLERTAAAGVTADQCWTLEQVEERIDEIASLLRPIESLDLGMQRWQTPQATMAERLRSGQPLVVGVANYVEGLAQDDRTLPSGWAQPLVLLNSQGKAFGMGAAVQSQQGSITINMKRGL